MKVIYLLGGMKTISQVAGFAAAEKRLEDKNTTVINPVKVLSVVIAKNPKKSKIAIWLLYSQMCINIISHATHYIHVNLIIPPVEWYYIKMHKLKRFKVKGDK